VLTTLLVAWGVERGDFMILVSQQKDFDEPFRSSFGIADKDLEPVKLRSINKYETTWLVHKKKTNGRTCCDHKCSNFDRVLGNPAHLNLNTNRTGLK